MDLSLTTTSYGQDNQSWLGSAEGTDTARSGTLKISTLTAGTHYPSGVLPSGVAVGRITASGLYGLYNNGASDGTQTLVGFTLSAVKVGTADVGVAIIDRGRIVESNLPFAVNSAAKTNTRFTWV